MSRGRNTAGRDSAVLLAQHFTPPAVADLVWGLVRLYAGERLGPGSRVIDPAAGRGALLEAVRRDGLVPAQGICGIEVDAGLVPAWGAGGQQARVLRGDGLTADLPGVAAATFDAVVGNPPFGRCSTVLTAAARRRAAQRLTVWRAGPAARRRAPDGLTSCPVELLFVERALELLVPGGTAGLILPEGFCTNLRLQWARDWVLQRACVRAVVALPDGVFRRTGLSARAAIVVLQPRPAPAGRPPALLLRPAGGAEDTAAFLRRARQLGEGHAAGRRPRGAGARVLPHGRLTGQRWDASFWLGQALVERLVRRLDLRPLGDFVELLAYGPIITGRRPVPVPAGVRVVRQTDFAEAGLRRSGALHVEPGCDYDPLRTRVRRGDLLLPRSGAGSLGRNRMAVMVDGHPANVSCFVDLVRLGGIDPFYVWLFLRSAAGWGQVCALQNGVGTPNISFAEIRSLRVPVLAADEQSRVHARYLAEVWPLLEPGPQAEAREAQAAACFAALVRDVEALLSTRAAGPPACPSSETSLHSYLTTQR